MSVFQKHPKKIVFVLFVLLCVFLLFLTEFTLQKVMGLGNPVLYHGNPIYGYRLQPNQDVKRFMGARVKTNNLGLRANDDWDDDPSGKMLFFGDSVTYGGSYVGNDELFAIKTAKNFGFSGASAGVNSWGVENIHGLVVESDFFLADYNIVSIIEGDFNRGMKQLDGLPFWGHKPRFALQELLSFKAYQYSNKRYKGSYHLPAELKLKLYNKAAAELASVFNRIKSEGKNGILIISPEKRQLLKGIPKWNTVKEALDRYNIKAYYIMDYLPLESVSEEEIASWYHDGVHLTPKGHKVWSDVMTTILKKEFPELN